MPDSSAGRTRLSDPREQRVGYWHDCRCCDGGLNSSPSRIAPLGDDGSIAEFGDRHDREEELVVAQCLDVRFKRLSTSPAERRAEDARVDDQPHDVTAAANASSSSSVRPSISKASTESRTGAASNSSDVRSRGNKLVPCGTSRRSFAASLTAKLYRRSRWRTSRESIGRCVNNLIRANSWRRAPPQRSRLVALSQVPAEWRRHNNGLAEDLHRRSSWVNYGGPPVS